MAKTSLQGENIETVIQAFPAPTLRDSLSALPYYTTLLRVPSHSYTCMFRTRHATKLYNAQSPPQIG